MFCRETSDETAQEVLPFYICYRACVRRKVISFQLDEPEVPVTQREAAQQEARSLFDLAAGYACGPTRPTLLMIGGVMGTGKSTLALDLRQELGWPHFSSDVARKRLAHVDPAQPYADAFAEGQYGGACSVMMPSRSTSTCHARSEGKIFPRL